jgi:glycosyltransferase involved in cell wall biosynthesis
MTLSGAPLPVFEWRRSGAVWSGVRRLVIAGFITWIAHMLNRATPSPNPSAKPAPAPAQWLSVVVPVYNEQDNIAPLVEQVALALTGQPWPWELILVDDGSADCTAERVRQAVASHPGKVRALVLRRHFGQTAATQAGLDIARGSIIATMDGDLQNHPQDLPRMVRRLLDDDLDLLVGWRQHRQDNLWLRKVPSWLANRLVARVTGIALHDYGCALKVFRASVVRQIRLYGEMHRFIPTWMATITCADRIGEVPVSHYPRVHGQSKYGLSRVVKVIPDLLAMVFFMRYLARPGHFFGRIGLLLVSIGAAILTWLAWTKLVGHEAIGNRPLLMLGMLLSVVGVQFLSTGILTEMLMRVYYESSDKKPYHVRSVVGDCAAAAGRAGDGQASNEWPDQRTACQLDIEA